MPMFEEEYAKRELGRELGQCLIDLHNKIEPLGMSIADVMKKLDEADTEAIECDLPFVGQLTLQQAEAMAKGLEQYEETVEKLSIDTAKDSWNGIVLNDVTESMKEELRVVLPKLMEEINNLQVLRSKGKEIFDGTYLDLKWNSLEKAASFLGKDKIL